MNNKEYIIKKNTDIRRNKKDFFITNIYVVPDDIEQIYENENALAFLVIDKGVRRAYFSANDINSMISVIASLPEGSGIEIIDRGLNDDIEYALNEAGYKHFATYLRATNRNIKDSYNMSFPEHLIDVECKKYCSKATLNDEEKIYDLLYDTFNPLTSHLQNHEELIEDIRNEQVVVSYEADELTTVLTYEFQGKKLYMEHMINKGDSKLMHSLYVTVLEEAISKGINVAYTWMREDNPRALAFAGRYGVIPDGIKNYVYVKQ